MTHHHSNFDLQQEKDRLMIQLKPYEDLILRFEEILYGKQPTLLILGVIIFDSVLIFGHITQMGIISLFTLYCIVVYVLYFLQHRFHIMRLVPKIDIIKNENAQNVQIHSLEEVCLFLASLKQKSGMIADYLLGNQFENIYKIIYVLAVWFTLAFVFNIIGNFWLFFIILNLSLLTPGFNIIKLIFGWLGKLTQALFGVFVNPPQGENGHPVINETPQQQKIQEPVQPQQEQPQPQQEQPQPQQEQPQPQQEQPQPIQEQPQPQQEQSQPAESEQVQERLDDLGRLE